MKGLNDAFGRLLRTADIPPVFDQSLPEMRISAMRYLVIEPHRGVRSFSDDGVLIETRGGLVHIRGKGMVIKSMTWRELRLQGQISAVELIADHAL